MKTALFSLLFLVSLFFTACKTDPTAANPDGGSVSWGVQPPLPTVSGETRLTLSGSDSYVNVMENAMPRMPNFPALKAREGKLIGYVADLSGKPLEGAYVGVRSTVVGGSYSSATAETDENGYYEILVPWGAAEIWAAGYHINYNTGKAAMGLYPADGKAKSFESTKGMVKNFVLLSYGLADENERAQRPWSPTGYFGGSLYINYNAAEPGDPWASKGSLPLNADVELKLTPEGEMLYGETRSFIITKKVENLGFTINNIPVGRYTISARLKDGRQVKLRQTGPYVSLYPHHGLKPKEAVGSASVWFTPLGTETYSGGPNRGNWRPVDIKLELP